MSKLIFKLQGKYVTANIIDSVIKCTYYTFKLTVAKYIEITKYMNDKVYHTVGMNIITNSNERVLLVMMNKDKLLSIKIMDICNEPLYEDLMYYDDIIFLQ